MRLVALADTLHRYAGLRVLVTGGAGFVGSHLVDALLTTGVAEVQVVDDLSLGRRENLVAALADERASLHVQDAIDQTALEELAGGRPFDLCFNLAVIPLPHSLNHPRANVDRNIAMTTSVCELTRAGLIRRLVQFSSSEVYGSAIGDKAMDEEHPMRPHTPYAAAKAGADLAALSYVMTFDLDVVVVRPFNTYGERQNDAAYAGLIPAVIRRVLAGEPVVVNGDGEQTRDMTYVSDTVAGALALAVAEGVSGHAFNLGYGDELSVNRMVELMLESLGHPDHPVVHGPPRPGDVKRLLADVSAAREAVGYAPEVDPAEGFARTVAWYQSAPASASTT
jgi:UDP-glucose 4-epimerase